MSELALFGGSPVRTKSFPSWPRTSDEIREHVLDTLNNEKWGVGSKTIAEFNDNFANYHDAKYCISLHSGTSALWVALKAAGVKAGDEVIIPAYTFIATATAVLMANAVPRFADIDLKTGNIDPNDIVSKISDKTKVILPVHIGGSPVDLKAIKTLAETHNVLVIEDAAQAHGARYGDKKVGAIGLGGIFSFQSSKNMSSGEGGAIITNDESFADACFSYHNCGRVRNGKWYEHHRLGSNLRMSALNAAMLIPQLDTLVHDMNLRDKNRESLDNFLNGLNGLTPMEMSDGATRSANHIYICRYNEAEFSGISRETFFKAMQAEGVYAYKGYNPLYREP
ncbi:MAG: DegT/DnrJ/EryC1/StrS family aminotransferase, partial [Candidatus Marinimicrobia bacterium]|nr:DegT/DnrJ/EryC1/StrS family aminotransferase [Candidatus Neomarinimicrobiota bacterium]